MKKIIGLLLAAAVMVGVATLYAQGGCSSCGTSAGAKGCPLAGKADTMGKLNLNDEQKAKIVALREECTKAGRTPESCAKFMKSMESVLTAEQLTAWKAACQKAKQGGGCPSGACGS